MIGQRIESRQKGSLGAVFWIVIAGAFVALAAVFQNLHFLIFAALPVAIGVVLFIRRERPFVAQITEDGLEIENPELSLPYAAIEGALMEGWPETQHSLIRLIHADGVVNIPERLNVRSNELFGFLLGQLPPNGTGQLQALLAKYREEQRAHFGPERVFSYRARPHRANTRQKTGLTMCIGCVLAGLLWIAAGLLVKKNGEGWITMGILVVVISGLCAVAYRSGNPDLTPLIKNWRQSGLVISPAGLALIQGDMRGEMEWDELRDIRYRQKPRFGEFRLSNAQLRGIDLIVAGATITIADIYDRPLPIIHKRLMAYWQGDDSPPED